MKSFDNSTASRDIAHVLHPYTNLKKHQETGPLVLTEGKGVWLYDDKGKAYLDGMAGSGVRHWGTGRSALWRRPPRKCEENHQSPQGLSRRHHRGRQHDRAAAQPSRLRICRSTRYCTRTARISTTLGKQAKARKSSPRGWPTTSTS